MAVPATTNPRDPRGGFPTRINQRIRVPEVFLIGPGGEQLGVVDTRDAQDRARAAGKKRGRWLQCGERSPVLDLDQLVRLEDGTPVEWGSVWMPANRCVISSVRTR